MAHGAAIKQPLRLEAERLCKLHDDSTPTRTLARRLAKEFNVSIEVARSTVRHVRGSMGKCHRETLTGQVRRPLQKAGWKPSLPPSKAEEWTPFELDGSKRVGVVCDWHLPFHSELAVSKSVAWLKKQKIDTLLFNGDFGDWYSVSRFQKNPKHRNFKEELSAQRSCLEWLRSEFPKSRIILKKGNHDERWDHYIWNHFAELSDDPLLSLEAWVHADKHGVEVVGDQRPIMAGKLPILHGHELPKGLASPVNPARGAYLRMSDTVMVGHSHRTSGHAESDWLHNEVFCWSVGCGCGLNPEYARINKWNWGLAMVDIAADKQFDVHNMRVNSDGAVRSS